MQMYYDQYAALNMQVTNRTTVIYTLIKNKGSSTFKISTCITLVK